jgi:hypothetical protein
MALTTSRIGTSAVSPLANGTLNVAGVPKESIRDG